MRRGHIHPNTTATADSLFWPWDINRDGGNNVEDLTLIAVAWLTDTNDADFDDSGTVDGIDFGTITQDWQEGIN